MIIIPAIDLKDHHVVRLSQGRMGEAKVYSDDPVAVAKKWVKAGAQRIHIVDLNGAFEGKPIHFDEVKNICHAFPKIKIEIGGGIRDLKTSERYFQSGASYCIFGTSAVKNPQLIVEATQKFPEKIILGIDAKGGMVAVEGWGEVSKIAASDLVKKFTKIESVIYTDISKDGMMQGMSFEQIKKMAAASRFPIIASGGFTSLKDIGELKKISNILGVIAGKALYEGLVDLKEAIAYAGASPSP